VGSSPHAGSPRTVGAPRTAGSADSEAGGPLVFVAGVALGVVIGAGAALLLAPASGVDTRHALARRGRRLRRHGRDAWDDLRREFRHALARRKREALRKHARMAEAEADELDLD
jgi:gas vesicle protein